MKFNTKTLTVVAMLTALNTVLNIFSIPITASNYISFTIVPCFIAGIYLGPIAGLVVGLTGDILGSIISPKGSYIPLVGIASALLGLIPGLVYKLPKVSNIVKLLLSLTLCLVICTAGLNTLGLYLYVSSMTKTFWLYLWARLPFQALNYLANFVALVILANSNVDNSIRKMLA